MTAGHIPGARRSAASERARSTPTTAWLDQLVPTRQPLEKLLLIHQFTDDMIPEAELKERAGLAYVLNVDGFGTQSLKIAKYRGFVAQAKQFRRGFKLFYSEDQNTMTPAQVMRLDSAPRRHRLRISTRAAPRRSAIGLGIDPAQPTG